VWGILRISKKQSFVDSGRGRMNSEQTFDQVANRYEAALNDALSVSGETNEFFARCRVQWMALRLKDLDERPQSVLDFGCGVGGTTPLFREILGVDTVTGVDVSGYSIMRARERFGSERDSFGLLDEHAPTGAMDLAYCNGVFHHIPPEERSRAAEYVFRSLRSGGLFAFWENNSGNPATRYVMSRCQFDTDAIPLKPDEARGLLTNAGFSILRTDFRFIFPRQLSWLRVLEPALAKYPLGTQYMILCRKPGRVG
jgi:SAM-dependent methyltransferase